MTHVVLRSAFAVIVVAILSPNAARADAPRTRDGLFLRLGVGVAGVSMERTGHISSGGSAPYYVGDSKIAGGAGASELTIGGMLRPGLVLAGTFISQNIANPTLRSTNSEVALDGPLHFVLLGVSLEYLPNPQGGFHFGGTLALAGAYAKSPPPRFTEYLGGGGGAISLGAGYLWWVSEQWSLGLQARLTGARVHGETTQLGITGSEDDTVSAFALMFTGVYN